ncbi:MAG: hypothetical protein IT249_18535 [Chitinophagaceae bacterium]|nr:hypothetical protein [Chitinophagaceae bacterium]
MKACCLILHMLIACAISYQGFAQDVNTSTIDQVPLEFSKSIIKRTERLDEDLDKKSAKALRKYQKYQSRILKKLSRVDSIAARNFSIISDQKYRELQNKLAVPTQLKRYIPSLDTISSSLKYLKLSPALGDNMENVSKAISSVKGLTERLKSGESIKEYLNEEKIYIKEQLERFGLAKELRKVNKNLYYFSEELIDIKETLSDQSKIERKVIYLLNQTKAFQQFIQKHGMLASILSSAGQGVDDFGSANIAGLQTRAGFNQLIQNQVAAGGPNAQNIIRENFQQGQEQLQQLKNKLTEMGSRGSDDIMPDGFVPNNQRAKSFLKRLELNTNMQSQRASNYFPVATDLGLGLGYRISGAAIIGAGASYRVGWGQNIQHIRISHQGLGLRSYIDMKFPTKLFGLKNAKGTWWITGGYERNYRTEIKKIDELKNYSAWQASGLIGVSKNISFSSKFFKGTKLQFLWDFLSYKQIPRTSPIVFRVGYNIK